MKAPDPAIAERNAKIRAMRNGGVPKREIAERIGCSAAVVANVLYRRPDWVPKDPFGSFSRGIVL